MVVIDIMWHYMLSDAHPLETLPVTRVIET